MTVKCWRGSRNDWISHRTSSRLTASHNSGCYLWNAADDAPQHLSHSNYSHANVAVRVEANYFYPTAMTLPHPMAAYEILIIFGVDFNHFWRCDLHLQKYNTYCIYGIYMWAGKVGVEVTVITLLRKPVSSI